jgi:hypothetical protein
MRDRRIRRVETTDTEKILAPHRQAGGGQRGHIALRLRQVEMLRGIGRSLMKRCSGQPARAHDQPGVLDLSVLVKQFRRDRAHLGILQRLDQILDPIRLRSLHVVVEKNQPLPSRGLRADVAFVGKIERLVVGHEAHGHIFRFEKF